ncbi:hypothetical protein [Campylobacter ureolyticus]|uniref:hypothetical protein n=1 Tax=Campylobacter ureolyticus TaxID=827 RepID=UPI0022B3BFDE|nr:hypothetical protein [Campylobacter ureolyticus]MCZ6135519.1 hypothetical protein [Campylobacter ureolyticus]MCZ6171486.1 hypothetical protein [Campylobacter ureolyticus]
MLDGKLKRKIDINEIPNYLLKPFWKNRFDTEVAIFILVIVVFIVSLWLIYATKPKFAILSSYGLHLNYLQI